MKTKIFSLTILLFFLAASSLFAQQNDVIIVRFVDVPTTVSMSPIVGEINISYGDGNYEKIELDKVKKEYPKENLDKLNRVITKLLDEGYEIISTATNNPSVGSMNSTFWIFRKTE